MTENVLVTGRELTWMLWGAGVLLIFAVTMALRNRPGTLPTKPRSVCQCAAESVASAPGPTARADRKTGFRARPGLARARNSWIYFH